MILAAVFVVVAAALVCWRREGSSARLGRVASPWDERGARAQPGAASDGGVPLDRLVTEVATMLRSGAPPAAAWARVGVLADMSGVPDAQALRARSIESVPRRSPGRRQERGVAVRSSASVGRASDLAHERRVDGVIAGCRVAADVGASLAPVLDGVAAAVVRAREGEARRSAALAGPQATARLLGWLPAGGLGIAVLMGADLGAALTRGGLVTTSVIAGAVLMVAGRRWSGRLVRDAAAARG